MSGNYSGVNEHSQVRHRKLPKLGTRELTNSRVSSCHCVSLQLSFNLVVLRVLCCGASVLSPHNYLDDPTLTREVVWLFPSSHIQQFPCPNPSIFAWPASWIRSKSVWNGPSGPGRRQSFLALEVWLGCVTTIVSRCRSPGVCKCAVAYFASPAGPH